MKFSPEVQEVANQLYDTYCDAVGGVAFNGDPLPKSKEFFADKFKEKQTNAWLETAQKAVDLLSKVS